ncbi:MULTISPECIES: MarR family winged helix-turn-helix transcriptional regulator [Staphylococcus]|uniref:MarR family winged helix-turn-helix transcriptional regulator n=2 Tax=Staphylococcus TaxID=1279 RepID=UPI000D1DFBDB|nr:MULTISPECIES: MarR family transcriptional regulator [Staphylococcus]MBF2757424.1 MarR family transcriptional regulator [Staphylococcus haemolyticus]MBF2774112.1 MarR family transcriptional regulator [Staphylococcus haemolyticus]MBF2776078.1 MarR family transcriptional regulator [Staphylococcus haemolyticus]MBF2815725.1 MarR family transcriptional regulator [Staphylococcus haemolyticus]MBF9719554.1 MarR family transcriptional regulator [Staphylococcus haemolyticus]
MSRISRNHIEFMKQFIDDTNTLTAKLLKDQQSKYGISMEQSNVLRLLSHHHALSITEITEKQGVNKAAVSRRIKKLIDSGFVALQKSNNNIDQRLKYVVLTDKGRQYTEENNEIVSDIVSDMVADLSSKDIEKALSVLYIIDERVKKFNSKV